MTTKKCFKCGEEKPIDEFYVNKGMADGHLHKCKECAREDQHVFYRAKIHHYAEYEKLRYLRTDRRLSALEYQRKRRANNPEKYQAVTALGNAIRDGKIKKQPCEVCGSIHSQAHHDDYSKPLEVRWLCRTHHLEAHGKKSYEGITYEVPR
jgi:hypothetical protein